MDTQGKQLVALYGTGVSDDRLAELIDEAIQQAFALGRGEGYAVGFNSAGLLKRFAIDPAKSQMGRQNKMAGLRKEDAA